MFVIEPPTKFTLVMFEPTLFTFVMFEATVARFELTTEIVLPIALYADNNNANWMVHLTRHQWSLLRQPGLQFL